ERGAWIGIISWGGREDLALARQFPWLRVYANVYKLPQPRYERLMPLLHALPLINADVIKCNQTNGGDVALRCAHFWRSKPFVARCGYVWSEFMGKEHPDLLAQTLNLEREVFSRCHKAIVTTGEAARYLAHTHKLTPDKFTCIANYVSDPFYAAPLPDYRPVSPAIITQVGRLAPQKNLFALLEACAGLNVTVRIIGDGEERDALQAKARRLGVGVEFKGNVPHEQLPQLLAKSTVCTLVSHFEGHPKALIEYMARGCPVLATNVPGINTVVTDGVSGLLCATDAASIRRGLKKLLGNPALRERLGRQGREEAKKYSLDAILQEEWKIHTSFPRLAPPQKWAMALRVMAGYGKRKCRHYIVRYVARFLAKCVGKSPEQACIALDTIEKYLLPRLPEDHADQRVMEHVGKRFAGRSPETTRALLGAVDDKLFLSLPDDQAIAAIEERFSKQIAARTPQDALRMLFALDARLYQKQGQLAVAYDGGVHTKHRHTKYHDFFVNRLRKNDRVLDVGCGIGFLAFDMAETGALVTGIDISEANIQTARERFPHPNVTHICGNALADLPEGAYETIVLSNVLEHLPKRPEFLRSLQERLNPKRYLIRVPLFEREWRVPLKKELGVEWRLDPTHETEYTLESFAEELEGAHLRSVHQEVRWSEIWCEAHPK
ncbi:MAG: glycosyltransferase, partial [Clostridiales bacterium]|nr:glycosyltransferase [Clostridiales bacterium]